LRQDFVTSPGSQRHGLEKPLLPQTWTLAAAQIRFTVRTECVRKARPIRVVIPLNAPQRNSLATNNASIAASTRAGHDTEKSITCSTAIGSSAGYDGHRNQKAAIVEHATQRSRGRSNHPGLDLSERSDAVSPLPFDAAAEAQWMDRTH